MALGGPGLFVIAFLDSSFISLPQINDLLVVFMVLQDPGWMPYYAAMATLGSIAGCYVIEGRITRSGDTKARLMRDGAVVHEGKIGSLRRFKDDVSEVKTGFECGIAFDKYNDVKVGDLIEVFTIERVAVSA